ncbi:MAG: RNA polymerase subunit sigma-70 [Maricaulis sp.]|jgi:RNA polymerase sigma-70 factor (ECF subfamily)|nr:RNA polymerase subunit sigma-70 [Maricaulis sp.]HAQ36548.1 RNA polymerase subunit sigma-70 [Alphaproteobacteria bacterium]|tara:strand:+ start:580 stop:1176 length:597 start_codon:yes stop_codon:yes gene_type:complete
MTPDKTSAADALTFRQDLAGLIPHLRAFARSLCNNAAEADDLAQEALVKAWQARERFEPGTNLKAWVFMILRNHFYSERRKAWRKNETSDDGLESMSTMPAGQDSILELADLRHALSSLPPEQREALILVGAGGFAYEEVAEICECAVGTIKSRVNRARAALAKLMDERPTTPRAKGDALRAAEEIIAEAHALAGDRG